MVYIGIQLGGAALGFGTGSAGGYLIGIGAINLWNPGRWIMMAMGAGVIISGTVFINTTQNTLYREFGIK